MCIVVRIADADSIRLMMRVLYVISCDHVCIDALCCCEQIIATP
jgi:hypothetical protein